MSQDEHVLHQLKQLYDWTLHANKQMARIVWMISILLAITFGTLLVVLFK